MASLPVLSKTVESCCINMEQVRDGRHRSTVDECKSRSGDARGKFDSADNIESSAVVSVEGKATFIF